MGERANDERLEKLKASGETVYSYSRLTTFNTCLYAGYLGYVLKKPGRDNIWNRTGGKIHDVLEQIVNGEATEADLLPAVNAELEELEMIGIDFPKDAKGGDSLRENWIKDIFNFCQTYKSPKGDNLKTEEMFIYETPKGRHLVGYIDLYALLNNNTVCIFDYKSSSLFTKENLLEHGRQLSVYARAMQQQGYKVRQTAWIYMKYVEASYFGKKTARSKNKEQIVKVIERRKIGEELSKPIAADLEELGYDEITIENYISDLVRTNMLNNLPREIQKAYRIRPYVQQYPVDEETLAECDKWVDDTIDMWEALDKSSARDFPPRSFTKTSKTGKTVNDCFFCCNLCSYGAECPYLHDFLEMEGIKKKEEQENEELFG